VSERCDWRCKSCGFVLGEIVDGKLRPLIVAEETDSHGVSRYRCPGDGCGREKACFPDRGQVTLNERPMS
jgi:hypothetical protein